MGSGRSRHGQLCALLSPRSPGLPRVIALTSTRSSSVHTLQGNFTQTYLAGWFDEDEHMGTTLGGPMCATPSIVSVQALVRSSS